jgi:hypothetical protein
MTQTLYAHMNKIKILKTKQNKTCVLLMVPDVKKQKPAKHNTPANLIV